jgi:hypothetical protein
MNSHSTGSIVQRKNLYKYCAIKTCLAIGAGPDRPNLPLP